MTSPRTENLSTRPLLLSGAGKALVVVFLVLGAVLLIFDEFISATYDTSTTSQAPPP